MPTFTLGHDSDEHVAELLGVIEQWHKQRIEALRAVLDAKEFDTIKVISESGEICEFAANSETGLGVRLGAHTAISLFENLPFKVTIQKRTETD